LLALRKSSEDLRLKVRTCSEGKAAKAGDGAAVVVCVFLARSTLVQVVAERMMLRGRELLCERSVDEMARGLMKVSLHAVLPPVAPAARRGPCRSLKRRW